VKTSPSERLVIAPGDRRRAVLDVVESAQQRLVLSVFRCDDREIVQALAAACRRGVRVEALMTGRAKGSKAALRLLQLLLEQIGVRVSRYGDRRMKYHGKFIVADHRRALVGSLNLTRKCFDRTSDFLLVSRDRRLAQELVSLFDHDAGLRLIRPQACRSRLIVSPDDARRRFVELLGRARRRIRIIDPKLSDGEILDLLRRKERAGLEVEVLRAPVLAGLVSHGRAMVLDDRLAIVGSMALSATHLDRRREVAVLVEEAAAVRALNDFFDVALRFGGPRPVAARVAGQGSVA
jgi:phosphatidylserine/phosphatidylglycerophosphate/cardiolipin synthase-like enzyme